MRTSRVTGTMGALLLFLGSAACSTSDKPTQAAPVAPCKDVAQCASQCTKGHLSACGTQGQLLLNDGKDPKGALAALKKSCDGGVSSACALQGVMHERGLGTKADAKQATALYTKACNSGDALGCANLGALQLGAEGDSAPNVEAAKSALAKACKSGATVACRDELTKPCAAAVGPAMQGAPVATDPKELSAQCDKKNLEACQRLGEFYMYREKPDAKKAVAAWEKACDGKVAAACTQLGFAYSMGSDAVKKDLKKAASLFDKGCKGKDPSGCTALANAYAVGEGVEKDEKKAVKMLSSGCKDKNAMSCSSLGFFYLSGQAVKKNEKKGLELLDKACTLGDASGCQNYAMHLVQQKKPDYKQARAMLKKACDQMLLQACTFLGNLSEFGRGTKKDKKQAMALYEKACKGGDEMGCRAKKGGVDIIKEIQSPPAPPPDASGAVPPPPPAGSEAPPPPPPPK